MVALVVGSLVVAFFLWRWFASRRAVTEASRKMIESRRNVIATATAHYLPSYPNLAAFVTFLSWPERAEFADNVIKLEQSRQVLGINGWQKMMETERGIEKVIPLPVLSELSRMPARDVTELLKLIRDLGP